MSGTATSSLDPVDVLDTPEAGPATIRGSLLRGAGYIAGMLLSVVSVSLLIRQLGVVDYGRYVTVISLVTIVQGVTDIGLGQIGVREFATRAGADRERLMRNLMGIRVALTSAGVVLATGFSWLVGYGSVMTVGTAIAGLGMVLTVTQGTFAIPLSAELRLGWVTALELMRQSLTVILIVILALAGANLLSFLSVSPIASLAALTVTGYVIGRAIPKRPAFDRREGVLLLKAVLPFAAAVAIGTVYLRVTVIITSLLASHVQTGYYATSFRVLEVLIGVPVLVVGTALPVLSRAARDDARRLDYVLQRLFETTLIIGVGTALALAAGAGFAIGVLTGGGSPPAVEVLQIQSLAIAASFVGASCQYALLSLHRHRALLAISAGALALSVVLSLVLVPVIQARGAAAAFTAGELLVAASSMVLLLRAHGGSWISRRVPLRVALAAALSGAVVLIPGVGSLGHSLLATVVYVTALATSKAIPPELRHAFRRGQVSA